MTVYSTKAATLGPSPKVTLPAGALGVVGLVLFAASFLGGLEDLREIGLTLFVASPLAAAIGYQAKPGTVKIETPAGVVGQPPVAGNPYYGRP